MQAIETHRRINPSARPNRQRGLSFRPLVRVKHAAATGRVRFEVRGLYESPLLAAQLYAELSSRMGVRILSISTVTSTVLIQYEEPHSPQTLLDMIDAFLRLLVTRAALKEGSPAGGTDGGEARQWHLQSASAVLKALGTEQGRGLTPGEVQRRRIETWANSLGVHEPRSAMVLFLRQFMSMPVGLLAGSAAVSLLTGGVSDAALISAVLLVNAGIGFKTESHAERIINSLGQDEQPLVAVIRGGERQTVPVVDLVVGDIVSLTAGPIPADIRLIKADHLTIDESALTGESVPVSKQVARLRQRHVALADRHNMVFSGTVVTGGSGVGVVVATGLRTEIGKVHQLVSRVRSPETALQRDLRSIGQQTVVASGVVCAGVFALGLLRGVRLLPMLKTAVSLAIAAVPEGLPAVGTTTLAFGVSRMQRHNVHVRRLMAIEGLGAIGAVCFDKTGTITVNKMTVSRLQIGSQELRVRDGKLFVEDVMIDVEAFPDLEMLLRVCVLCNEANIVGGGTQADAIEFEGSPTEVALLRLALDNGVDLQLEQAGFPRLAMRLRSEKSPYMLTVHALSTGPSAGKEQLFAVKGAPGEVLSRCSHYLDGGMIKPLNETYRAQVLAQNERFASKALRVLGIAYRSAKARRHVDGNTHNGELELGQGFVYVGLVGLRDPAREGIKDLVRSFHEAGITTLMMTGDQQATAEAIGHELGFNGDRHLSTLDARFLATTPEEDWEHLVEGVQVFARVSPTEKLRVVQALQKSGRVVAMIGDGVNDSPAIKAAHVGVAMGNGTRAAREAADVVLGDDELRTLYEAIKQGRTIRINLAKAMKYLLTTNLSEIIVTFGGVASGHGSPLRPMQLLWINLVTDIFPALALALDPPESQVMRRNPMGADEPLLSLKDQQLIVRESMVMAAGSLVNFWRTIRGGESTDKASTMAFLSLTLAQVLHTYSARSSERVTRRNGPLAPNPYIASATSLGLAAQIMAVSMPGLRSALGTREALRPADLISVSFGALAPFVVNEVLRTASASMRSSRNH